VTPATASEITMSLSLLGFGQLRTKPLKGERYKISWNKNGVLTSKFDDKTSVTMETESARGIWTVDVRLVTDEVRKDLKGVLKDSAEFQIR
jgi:hypothetical protein